MTVGRPSTRPGLLPPRGNYTWDFTKGCHVGHRNAVVFKQEVRSCMARLWAIDTLQSVALSPPTKLLSRTCFLLDVTIFPTVVKGSD